MTCCPKNLHSKCLRNPKHVEWVRALLAVLEESRKYVMEHHTTGVTWNHNVSDLCLALFRQLTWSKGIPIENYSTATAPAGQPGPPPPPPPPPAAVAAHALPPSSSGSPAALFAEINNADVTKGLRKVDKSEMTHKNPSLRAGSTVPSTPTESEFFTMPSVSAASLWEENQSRSLCGHPSRNHSWAKSLQNSRWKGRVGVS